MTNAELNAAWDLLLSKRVEVSDLDDTQRKVIYDKLFPEGCIINIDSTFREAGSRVEGSGKPNVNGGKYFIAITATKDPGGVDWAETDFTHFIHREL